MVNLTKHAVLAKVSSAKEPVLQFLGNEFTWSLVAWPLSGKEDGFKFGPRGCRLDSYRKGVGVGVEWLIHCIDNVLTGGSSTSTQCLQNPNSINSTYIEMGFLSKGISLLVLQITEVPWYCTGHQCPWNCTFLRRKCHSLKKRLRSGQTCKVVANGTFCL